MNLKQKNVLLSIIYVIIVIFFNNLDQSDLKVDTYVFSVLFCVYLYTFIMLLINNKVFKTSDFQKITRIEIIKVLIIPIITVIVINVILFPVNKIYIGYSLLLWILSILFVLKSIQYAIYYVLKRPSINKEKQICYFIIDDVLTSVTLTASILVFDLVFLNLLNRILIIMLLLMLINIILNVKIKQMLNGEHLGVKEI